MLGTTSVCRTRFSAPQRRNLAVLDRDQVGEPFVVDADLRRRAFLYGATRRVRESNGALPLAWPREHAGSGEAPVLPVLLDLLTIELTVESSRSLRRWMCAAAASERAMNVHQICAQEETETRHQTTDRTKSQRPFLTRTRKPEDRPITTSVPFFFCRTASDPPLRPFASASTCCRTMKSGVSSEGVCSVHGSLGIGSGRLGQTAICRRSDA